MANESERSTDRSHRADRRRVLQAVGGAGFAGLAGCLGDDDENGDDEPADDGNGDDDENGEEDPAAFEITALTPGQTSLTRGESVDVNAAIENTGEQEGTQTVALTFDGEEHDSDELTLSAGSDETVSFASIDTADFEPGDYDYEVTTEDDAAGETVTVETVLDDDPDQLLSFETDELTFVPGENTVSGTIENPYSVAIDSGQFEIELPDGWEVVDESGTALDGLEGGAEQDAQWEISTSDDADGEYELTIEGSYAVFDEEADVTLTLDVTVTEPMSAPFGLDCGGVHTEDAVEIDGLEFAPSAEQSAELDADDQYWPDSLTIDPSPNSSDAAMDENRPLTADSGYDTSPDIEGTDHDELYWTEHWEAELDYHFTIENGVYEVTAHISEVWDNEEGARDLTVLVNGEAIVEGLDPYAEYGPDTAITYTTTTAVDANELLVRVEGQGTNIAGIEIREAGLESGVAGHYDANALDVDDGDALAAWADATGEGLDLTQDDEDAQPTYHADGADGNATVRFEGNTDFGEGEYINSEGVPTESTAGVTMAVAFNTHDVTAERQTLLYNGSDDNGDGYGIFVNNEGGSGPDSEGYLHVLYGGVNWYWSDTAVEEDQFHVATLTISEDAPDQPELRLDGQLLTLEDQVEANPPVAPSDQFSIGQDTNDGHAPPYFHGDIGEAVVYDWELPTDQREELENQLGETWGVDVSHEIDGLAGHWTFDEESVEDGTVVDQSGNGLDGEIFGDVETGLESPAGQVAAAFSGDEDDEQLIRVEDENALDLEEFTVSAWVQVSEEADEWHCIVAKEGAMWCGLEGENQTARMDAYDGNEWDEGPWGEDSLNDGEWRHMVYRQAPSEGVSEIYLNGELEASVEAGDEFEESEQPLGIGGNPDEEGGWRDWLPGQIADVRVYDRPLSEAEIADLADA
ncbi:malectin domain-containing carbohydrate-binding protein [Halobacteria archaeon AArc-dxtr1]|nr:malectin domain-containing carbohydrate-binding protein [Halobacteria archaeon AArc-dxtr1]